MFGTVALRALAVVLVVIGVFPLANVLTDGRAVPWYGDVGGEWLQRASLLFTLVLVMSAVAGERLQVLIDNAKARLLQPSSVAFGVGASVVAFAAAAVVSQLAFDGQPFTSDEMAQQWHARILASGHLAAIAESPREFFNTAPVLDAGGHWFSQYPVGGPALIALGVLIGAPWLVNPVLLGLATWWLYRFLSAVTDELHARGATILFIASPMVLVMAASQMNHVPTLAFTALALMAVSRWDAASGAGAQARWAAVCGVAIGIVVLVRPLDALIVALLVGAIQVSKAIAEPRRLVSIGVQALAGSVPVALLMWANVQTTGSAMVFGYDALNGAAHGLGFHVDPTGDLHTPLHGLILVSGYLLKLSMYLFEYPLPGVLVIVAGIVAVRRPSRWDVLLAGLGAAVLVAYAAYWFDGFFAGPRFLFTAVPAFVYFAARLPGAFGDAAHPVVRRAMALVLPLCLAMAWLGPWGASSASSRIAFYREQRTKLKTPIEQQVREAGIHNALVFVTEGWRGELLARLRVLGASQFKADRMATTLDACELHIGMDIESTRTDPDSMKLDRVEFRAKAAGVAQPVPNLPGDQAISLVPGTLPKAECLAAFSRDSVGTMPFAMFLARQNVGADRRISGDVVFARDLGPRNEELRARFGDRTWYHYRPRLPGSDAPVFVPYGAFRRSP
jgi:hypothetical protein